MKSRGSTANALLGLLSIHPMSGYDLRHLVTWSIGHFWSESYGQIYPALKSLAAEGLVEKKTEQTKGRPERHVYSLTPDGRVELQSWLQIPAAPERPRNELLLKVFFAAHAGKGVLRDQVVAYEEQNRAADKIYAATGKKLKQEHSRDPQLPFWLMTLSYGRHQTRSAQAWCRETLRFMDEMEPQAATEG